MLFKKKSFFFFIMVIVQFVEMRLIAAASDVKGLSQRLQITAKKGFKELNLSRLHLRDTSKLDSLLTQQNRDEVQAIDLSYNDLKHIALSSFLSKFPNCRLLVLIHNPLASILEEVEDKELSDEIVSQGSLLIKKKQEEVIKAVYANGYRLIFDSDRAIPLTCALFNNEADGIASQFIKIGEKLKKLVEDSHRKGLLEGMKNQKTKIVMLPISCVR